MICFTEHRFAVHRTNVVFLENNALVAQGIEHRFPKPGVGGSNPPEGTKVCM